MPKRYIPAVIITLAIMVATAYAFIEESSYIAGMETTQGVVVKLGDRSTSSISSGGDSKTVNTQAIVDFQVNGSSYRVDGRGLGMPRWKIGQEVDVYYSPEKPRKARIKRLDELYFFTLSGSFFLVMIAIWSLINFAVYKVRGRPLS